MKIGDVIRTRSVRSYVSGPEAKGWAEFMADRERKPSKKNVFVLMLLGMEPLQCGEDKALDCERQLNALGFWGEDQIIEALGKDGAEKLVKKMLDALESKKDKEE